MTKGKWLRKSTNGLNVIFIHGINSSDECWRHENGTFWPNLLKNEDDLANVGIYLFSYRTGLNTGYYNLGDVVDSLKVYFKKDDLINSSGIIFVCHSMGGIVARRFLVNQQLELTKSGLKKIGLFLVASPSLGSRYANMLGFIISVMGHAQAEVLKFSQTNVWLNDLDKDFKNLQEHGSIKIEGQELIEDLPLFGNWLLRRQIVEPFAAGRCFSNPYKVPGSNHITIAKPANKDEIQHYLLRQFIEEFINKFFRKVDYSKLERLLSENKWKEADKETENIMLEVSDRKGDGWMDFNSVKNFPREDIKKINELWAKYSNGRFGFSEQIKIYLNKINPAGEFDESKWEELGDKVGWRKNRAWLKYSQINFHNNNNTPFGHLPTWVNKQAPDGVPFVGGGKGWWIAFLDRAHDCL